MNQILETGSHVSFLTPLEISKQEVDHVFSSNLRFVNCKKEFELNLKNESIHQSINQIAGFFWKNFTGSLFVN